MSVFRSLSIVLPSLTNQSTAAFILWFASSCTAARLVFISLPFIVNVRILLASLPVYLASGVHPLEVLPVVLPVTVVEITVGGVFTTKLTDFVVPLTQLSSHLFSVSKKEESVP